MAAAKSPQQYCMRWKNHQTNVENMFSQMLEKERFCDVTIYCSQNFALQISDKQEATDSRGVSLKAHRVVLAASSELLCDLLGAHDVQGEPVLVIDGVDPKHMKALLEYMYTGKMNVHHSQLANILKAAADLRIKGLTDIRWNNKESTQDCWQDSATEVKSQPQPDPTDRKILEAFTESRHHDARHLEPRHTDTRHSEPRHTEFRHTDAQSTFRQTDISHPSERRSMERMSTPERPETKCKTDPDSCETESRIEKFSVNGGPPPLIKLPTKEKISPAKRECSDA